LIFASDWLFVVSKDHYNPNAMLLIDLVIEHEDWKTASKFCQFYNKRAFKFSSGYLLTNGASFTWLSHALELQ
jgi:hypothetical protein